jgi:NHL repeat
MRVSLVPTHRQRSPIAASGICLPLLDPNGPHAILGGHVDADGLATPIAPRADTLFAPRGVCFERADGPLFVCDTGHHRLLIWTRTPAVDGSPADLLIGQADFLQEGRNANGAIAAKTLNVPTGVAAANDILAVADAWNHRILLWHGYPHTSNRGADVVLGQADFTGGLANRGAKTPRADTLNWCYGVAVVAGRLFVADTGNRRVLMWESIPTTNGAAADLVLGQRDFTTRDENAGEGAGALGMRWPHGIAVVDDKLLVADAGNNRIMVWQTLPTANGVPCDLVLGQSDTMRLDHNRAAYDPTANALNMPYGLGARNARIVVADTANSRLLGFEADGLAMGATATRLAGQHDFTAKGDNRWGVPRRDSLCWPYDVACCGDVVAIADAGNNRVLLWRAES